MKYIAKYKKFTSKVKATPVEAVESLFTVNDLFNVPRKEVGVFIKVKGSEEPVKEW